jgi:hypothetical protein
MEPQVNLRTPAAPCACSGTTLTAALPPIDHTMPAFATLADALDALHDSKRGIHYIAGETNERRVP